MIFPIPKVIHGGCIAQEKQTVRKTTENQYTASTHTYIYTLACRTILALGVKRNCNTSG